MAAASSSAGSIERMTTDVMMKASGVRLSPSTTPIQTILPILNGAWLSPNRDISAKLIRPMRGCSRNTQPSATAKPGISSATVIRVNTIGLPGKSVRSISQAIGSPSAKETISVTARKANVLRITR